MRIPLIKSRNRYWNKRFRKGLIYFKKPSKIIKLISPNLCNKTTNRVLIIGGGYGRNAAFLARRGFKVTSVDVSQKAISLGKELYGNLANLKLYKKDILNLNFKRDSFDVVIGIYILSLFTKKELLQIFKNTRKTLMDNGLFYCNFLSTDDDEISKGIKAKKNLFVYEDGQLVKFYEESELKTLFKKSNFVIDKMAKVQETRYINIFKQGLTSKSYLVFSRKK